MRFFALGILSSLTLVLSACGDDGKEPTSTATNTTPAGPTSDPGTGSNGTTTDDQTGSGTTADNPTTDTPTSTSMTTEPATSTTSPGTTTEPSTTTTGPDTTGEPGTTGSGTTGGGGGVGENYGPCSNEKMIMCKDTMFCIDPASTMDSVKGSFCSPECTGPGNVCPKPDGLSAQVQALCAFDTDADMQPDICALICNLDMDSCPEGSTCEDIGIPPMGNPPQNLGVCTHPLP